MRERKLGRILVMLAVFMLLLVLPVKVYASDDNGEDGDNGNNGVNNAVNEDTKGVVCILVSYMDDTGTLVPVQTGTGFFVNEETIVTCNHVVVFDDETIAQLMQIYDKDAKEIKQNLCIQVIATHDVKIDAKLVNSSEGTDYAFLSIGDALNNRTPLALRECSDLYKTEKVYALGFPAQVSLFQSVSTFTPDDVTITDGQITNISTLANQVDYIQHSATLNTGNSGGPLVDTNGAVIGINAMKTGVEGEDSYYYAIKIDQLIDTMDIIGIEYTLWDEGDPDAEEDPEQDNGSGSHPTTDQETEADFSDLEKEIKKVKELESSDYTDESYKPVKRALKDAEKLLDSQEATQDQIDEALDKLKDAVADLEEASKFPWLLVGIIAGVVVLLIVIILIIVIRNKKKKKAAPSYSTPSYSPVANPASMYAGPTSAPISGFSSASTNPATNFFASGVGAGETSVLNAGSGETTLLGAGAGETTLLKQGASLGTLTRVKSGERISINSDNFVIGKERSRVNYCISDNTSISRTHARFSGRGGVTYITDLKATNGTYVNGVKIQPNQENPLRSGDRISLADEEFTYTI